MNRTPVDSSNIRSVGYDPAGKLMEIEFHGGGLYQYHNVPAHEHRALIGAASIGSHFHKHFRHRTFSRFAEPQR